MGRRGGRGGGRGRGRGGRANGSGSYISDVQKNNADFEEYYKAQDIVPEGEWDTFLDTLRKSLPVTFRINGSGRFADHLRDKLQTEFFSHFGDGSLKVEGEAVQPPRPLAWYPNNYAWHTQFSRGQLRKIPLLDQFHEFIKRSNDVGSISRQEAVSMVPPLFLGVKAHHRVLDMCAAPGSKTFQLLESLHSASDESLPATVPTAGTNGSAATGPPITSILPQGLVIANDADYQRCSLLTHQLKRVNSPCLLITNHSADIFPILRDANGNELRFDRVLCDVPCSGDGTMRKAPDIWTKWTVMGGNGLHMIQLRIALHGIRMLSIGGRMVYSTCTFNPIEDEAVVSEILMRCGAAVKLVDVSDQLPELKRLPGKTHWKVRDKSRWYSSWEEAKDVGHRLEPSMFPTEEKAKLPLHRCMRFLPHHQDTGGFFVAVLEKVAELPDDFVMPKHYKSAPDSARAARAAVCAQISGKIQDPVAFAKSCAEEALQAAKTAVEALATGSKETVAELRKTARRASNEAAEAVKQSRAAAKRGRAEPQQPDNEDGNDDDEEMEAIPEEQAEGGDGGNTAVTGEDMDGEGDGMEVDGQEGDEKVAAGEGPSEKIVLLDGQIQASWIRGGGARGRDGKGGQIRYVDPIVPMEDKEALKSIREYYGLLPNFPVETSLVSRTLETSRPKRLYFLADPILSTLINDKKERLKVIGAGLKMFDRQEVKDIEGPVGIASAQVQCNYRIAQEGLPFILPYITKQRVSLGVKDFLGLLRDKSLGLPQDAALGPAKTEEAAVKEGEAAVKVEEAAEKVPEAEQQQQKHQRQREIVSDPEVLEALKEVRYGCLICELKASDAAQLGLPTGSERADALMAHSPMVVSAWRGRSSIAIMVDKAEALQMSDKIESAMKRAAA